MSRRADAADRPGYRLFLDSAEHEDWARYLPLGIFHGVTTNPTILERAGLRSTIEVLRDVVRDALRYPIAEVHAQCWGTNAAALVATGRSLAALDPRVVVKVPLTFEGVRAVSELHASGIRTTLTAVYAAHQALTAAAAGSDYVAPYYGRIGESGRDALSVLKTMQAVLNTGNRRTRLLVASLRGAADLALLAAEGIDTFTFGPSVARELFADEQTARAAETFETTAAR